MLEIVLFTLTGIILYFGANAALGFIEAQHGEPIPYRSVIFFVIIFVMALILFQGINTLSPGALEAKVG